MTRALQKPTTPHRVSAPTQAWSIPTLADIQAAQAVVGRYLPPTPLVRSEALNERLGCDLAIKCENLNPTGAFKIRGGINLLSQLTPQERARGVMSASTGNHGQSIAYAARLFATKATIFVPVDANPKKVASMRRLGAEIVFTGQDFDEAMAAGVKTAEEQGAYFIHSANEPRLIAGVGTYTLEIMDAIPDLQVLIVPIGAGSGSCGACIAGKGLKPDLKVIGVQATGAPVVYEAWKRHELVRLDSMQTFAEGLATRVAFSLPLQILWERIDDIDLVSDAEMRRAILTLLETTGSLAEGAGAAALAAAYNRREELAGKKVAVVLSGGNLTLEGLQETLAEERPW